MPLTTVVGEVGVEAHAGGEGEGVAGEVLP